MSKSIAILGAGVSGLGAAVLARKKGFNVFVSEIGQINSDSKNILLQNNISWEEGGHSEDIFFKADEIIKSPGIDEKSNFIQRLQSKNLPIISEVEFAFRYTSAKIAAVTGTNGKTTTTLLLGEILKNAGYDVLVAGNIGVGFALSIAERDYEYIVLELSSFQLDGIKDFRSTISIILNISSDHLDRYENNIENYKLSKFKITKNQHDSDFLIYNADDKLINSIQTKAKKLPISFLNKNKEGGFLNSNNELIIKINNKTMTIQELALQGKHNIFNSMAAAMAARVFEVQDSVIRKSLIDFQNIEHRLEYVLSVLGIDFINDSKATNINASWFALESMNKNTVWIVGGVDKGNDYSQLFEIVSSKVKAIICLGEDNQRIIKAFQGKVDTIVQASSMKEAVNQSFSLADKGEAVLLSPACASFDLFTSYEERGLQFKNEVRAL